MKSVVLLSVIFALAPMSVLTAATPADTKSDTVVEEIIARVDNHIITHSDYTRSQEQVRSEAQQQGMPSQELGEREKDVLRDLIDQQLLVEKGAEDGITGDTDLVKKLDEIRKQMGLGSMEELEKSAQAQGISYEDFKQNMRNNIVTQQVIQREVGSQIRVSKEEAQKFYNEHRSELERPEQVRLSEILVSTAAKSAPKADSSKPGPSSEATQGNDVPEIPEQERVAQGEARANQLLAEIRKGAKFDEVAKKNSDGPSAAQGGDLGLFKRGTLAKELEDTTFAMKAGEVSNVIRTKQGFVILQVTEHQMPGVPPFKEVEARVQDALYYQKLQPALRAYLTKLREQAFIDIKPGYVDSGASPNETKPIYTTASAAEGSKKLKKKKKFLLF